MFEVLKNIENTNCQSLGICRLDPRANALNELLRNEIKQIAFYSVKSNEFGALNKEIAKDAIEALCINFSSINFNEEDFIELYRYYANKKNKIMQVYKNFYKNNPVPHEDFVFATHENFKNSIIKMINKGEKLVQTKNELSSEKNVKLFELIDVLVRNVALDINKIRDFEPTFDEFDFEVLRLLNLANFPTTRAIKLKRRIKEFLDIAYKIKKKLNEVLEEKYGKRRETFVEMGAVEGKSLLVSGDNLKELETILETTKDEDINVYTNDVLFLAHTYPKFQQYKNLKGHFGSNDPYRDFANFEGVIFVTKNYEQKIDSIIRGSIFSSNMLTPKGITKISNNNFEPLIKSVLKHEGFQKNQATNKIKVRYNEGKIKNALQCTKDIDIFVGNKTLELLSEKDKIILNFDYPLETDLLFLLFENLKDKRKVTVIFSKCYSQTLVLALLLKVKYGCEIYFEKCPQYYISPHFLNCLANEYEIKFMQ